MKRGIISFRCVAFLIGLVLIVTCCGCETVKGMGRDIKKIDRDIRDHWW